MKLSSTVLAGLLAASSASASAPTPARKVYFPRHVKREFSNITTSQQKARSSVTSRDLVGDLLGGSSGDSNSDDSSAVTVSVKTTGQPSGVAAGTGKGQDAQASQTDSSILLGPSGIVTQPAASSTTKGGINLLPDLTNIIGGGGATDPTTTDGPSATGTASSSNDSGGITIGLGLGDSSSANTEPATTTAKGGGITIGLGLGDSSTSAAEPGTTSAPDDTGITIGLPGLGDSSGSGGATTTTSSDGSGGIGIGIGIGTGTSTTPIITISVGDPPVTSSTTTPITYPPITTTTTTSSTATGTEPPTSDPPITTSTTTTGPPTTISDPGPTGGSNTTTTTTSSTDGPTGVNTTTITSTTSEPVPPTSTSTTSVSEPTTVGGVTSLSATATVSSAAYYPSTVVVASSSSGASTYSSTVVPSNLPKAIAPDTTTNVPEDSILVQIAFGEGYKYDWLSRTQTAQRQLFSLLPQALAHDGGFNADNVTVTKIVAMDTLSEYRFITSLAICAIPSAYKPNLASHMTNPAAALFNNPQPMVFNMTEWINPAIGIDIGDGLDGSTTTQTGSVSTATSTSTGNGPFNNNDSNQSSSQRGEIAGISVGAVAVAGAYGAAMFLLARRYKRKKQMGHQRAHSVSDSDRSGTPPDMAQAPLASGDHPQYMGGANRQSAAMLSADFLSQHSPNSGGGQGRAFSNYGGTQTAATARTRDSNGSGESGMGNSQRTAFISQPIPAGNSLGWS